MMQEMVSSRIPESMASWTASSTAPLATNSWISCSAAPLAIISFTMSSIMPLDTISCIISSAAPLSTIWVISELITSGLLVISSMSMSMMDPPSRLLPPPNILSKGSLRLRLPAVIGATVKSIGNLHLQFMAPFMLAVGLGPPVGMGLEGAAVGAAATEIAVMVSAFFLIQWETLICLEPTLKATVTLPLLLVSGEHLTVLPFLTAVTSPLYLILYAQVNLVPDTTCSSVAVWNFHCAETVAKDRARRTSLVKIIQ